VLDQAAARENFDSRPGKFIRVSVSDTGCGMTPEVLSRIFDPFYTTKEIGKGTGLGLSTVHAIVQQHQGWIEVASEAGHGSTFKIFLPVMANETAPEEKAEGAKGPVPAPNTGETILVVEDEATVRGMARLALEQAGYRVLEAADGQEAIAIWERAPRPIELLLTDMVMPNGLSGSELAKELQTRDPRLRTIFTTGYGSEAIRQDLHLKHGVNFLPKPYDAATLLKTIRLCLKHGGQTSSQPATVPVH
jgi:CheY-like chemotaxis protein